MSKIVLDAKLDNDFIIQNTFKTNVTYPGSATEIPHNCCWKIHYDLAKKGREFELYDIAF
jgi:hypothetical protein